MRFEGVAITRPAISFELDDVIIMSTTKRCRQIPNFRPIGLLRVPVGLLDLADHARIHTIHLQDPNDEPINTAIQPLAKEQKNSTVRAGIGAGVLLDI